MAETREDFKGCARRRRINQLRKGGTGERKAKRAGGDLASLALLLLRGSPRRRVRRATRRGAPLLQGAVPAGADSPRRSSSFKEKNKKSPKRRKRKPPRAKERRAVASWRRPARWLTYSVSMSSAAGGADGGPPRDRVARGRRSIDRKGRLARRIR